MKRGIGQVRFEVNKLAFWRTVVRGAFAMLLVAALVVSDALPVGPPVGLPDAVEAADPTPKTGTITFYPVVKLKYNNVPWARDFFSTSYEKEYRSTSGILIYKYDGVCYLAKNTPAKDGKWPAYKVDILGCDYSPGVDEFYVRNYIRTYDLYKHGSAFSINLVADDYGYLGKAIEGDYDTLRNYEYNGKNPDDIFSTMYRSIWNIKLYQDDTVWISRNNAYYMGGKANNIELGLGPYSSMTTRSTYDFWLYTTDFDRKKTYTCINQNFTLGANQVYVADEDLFLSEDVKLTIPEGAVLCVKNGPFYVNGEIECYGTILVENGGSILPYASEGSGSRIVMKEGSAMIIRSGCRVYAGCPKDSLGTMKANGWLDMYAGSSIINFGLLVAGQCNFKYGQATIENHKGGAMFLGYAVDSRSKFLSGTVNGNSTASNLGLTKTGAVVHYGTGSNITVIKTWDGGAAGFANKASGGGQTVKLYSYDKDGKCKVDSAYKP